MASGGEGEPLNRRQERSEYGLEPPPRAVVWRDNIDACWFGSAYHPTAEKAMLVITMTDWFSHFTCIQHFNCITSSQQLQQRNSCVGSFTVRISKGMGISHEKTKLLILLSSHY
jgi:hypothetical protein